MLKLEDAKPEHFPEAYQRLIQIIGVDLTVRIAQEFAGETLYFPKIACLEQHIRDREIRRRFNGYNARELAREFGLTERRIRGIARRQ